MKSFLSAALLFLAAMFGTHGAAPLPIQPAAVVSALSNQASPLSAPLIAAPPSTFPPPQPFGKNASSVQSTTNTLSQNVKPAGINTVKPPVFNTVASSNYVTRDDLTAALTQATNSLRTLIYQNEYVPGSLPSSGGVTNNIAISNAIDQLTGTKLNNIIVNGVSGLTTSDIPSINLANAVSGTLPVASGGTGLASLASGYIPFGNGSSALGTSSSLFWDNANSRLGIGTSSPTAPFEVYGSNSSTNLVTGGGILGALVNADQTNGNFDSISYRTINSSGAEVTGTRISGVFNNHTAGAESADLAFLTRNAGTLSETMRILANGSVGIGTTSPSRTLSVNGSGYFTGGLTLGSTTTITPTYAGLGALSAALTFNDPSPLVGSTSIGYGTGVSTPELQVVTNGATNTFGITNTNLAGIASITLRGKDNSYTDNTTVFEHGAFFWIPNFGSGANQGLVGIEASRYDTANNPLIPPPNFSIQQTGGIDPTGGTTQICSIVNTSTTITCGSNLPANGSLITGVGTDIPAATTLVSGGGTTSGVMSNSATATNASASLNFSNPTYAVRGVMNSVSGGNLNFPAWDGTNMLSLDRINKRVGILTTAPQSALDVGGNARIAGTLSFATANYGIVSPSNVLHIGDVDSATPVVQTISFQNVAAGTSNTNAANAIIQGPLGTGSGVGGNLIFKTAGAGASGTQQGNAVTHFSILQTGQVLVSSSTSSIAPENGSGVPVLQIQNAVNNPRNTAVAVYSYGASTNAPANLYLEQSNSNTLSTQTAVANNTALGQVTFGGSDGTNFQNSSRITGASDGTVSAGIVPGRLVFQTANAAGTLTEALRINSAGNVGVGTTTPYARLSVWGPDSASSTLAFNVVNNASTTVFAVFDGGNAQLSGTLTQSSDQRLKTNIQSLDASSSLSLIDALNPVTFNWIDPSQSSTPQIGFIAQQVQALFPQLVSTTSATALTPDGTLGLNYIGLISPIISAIQGLERQITALANTVAGFADNFVSAHITAVTIDANVIHSQEDDTQRLCVGSTCVTPAQFQAMVSAANQSPSLPQTASPSIIPDATTTSSDVTVATTTDATSTAATEATTTAR